jgi:hypothetical protein
LEEAKGPSDHAVREVLLLDCAPMTRPIEGCCGTCGWLAKRVKPDSPGGPRSYEPSLEVDPLHREKPKLDFNLVPGETNAWKAGELACFRHVADLPEEIRTAHWAHGGDLAAEEVVWKDRHCPCWSPYEPGIPPREHLAEVKARQLEADRREFQLKLNAFETQQADRERRSDRRLMKAAIWLAIIIGAVQVVTSVFAMTPDAIGYPLWQWLKGLVGR